MARWEEYLTNQRGRHIEELLDFLRIPSISSLPEHKDDVLRAGEWVARRLKTAGFEHVGVMPTDGHPVVYGDWLHADNRPTIMVYGHFDVQPVDPLDLWSHPPFDPFIENDRIYARGVSDDKGNMLAPILAAEALLRTRGELPVNLKMFFEGQEEIGSPNLPDFIGANRELLRSDLVLGADGGQWSEDQPALTVRRRGLGAVQIEVRGARADKHSGSYGGSFLNPISALARLIASMHDPEGTIAVQGFYDDVQEPSEYEASQFAKVPYDESEFRDELGVDTLFGEPGFSTYERIWVRPTLEVNGIWGGFQGEGLKTVIPSRAYAKISCRLVPNQDPDRIIECISDHVALHAPAGVTVRVRPITGKADPYVVPYDHPGNQAAKAVLRSLYGKEPHIVGGGGTVPVCGIFFTQLKVHMVNFSFGLKDENIHAPDEFFRLGSFDRALKAYAMILEELGGMSR